VSVNWKEGALGSLEVVAVQKAMGLSDDAEDVSDDRMERRAYLRAQRRSK
jgi:hypothetical protein